jgi:iron complex outermembrane receptor protein
MSEIRQIEIVSGPNTALFGFNAVAGVVNIITYDPMEDHASGASATVGSMDYVSGSFWVTHAFSDRASLRISGGGTEGDGWDRDDRVATGTGYTGSSGLLDSPGLNMRSLNAQLGVQFTPRIRGDLEVSGAHDDRLEMLSNNQFGETAYETQGIKGALTAETSIGVFEGHSYLNTLQARLNTGSSGGAFDNHIFVAGASWLNRVAPAHTLRLAAEYRHNFLEQGGDPGEITYDDYSISGMWNWQINPELASTTAIRLDHLDLHRSGPVINPAFPLDNADYNTDVDEPSLNFGLVYRPTPQDSFRFSLARGLQSPSLLEYGLEVYVPTPVVVAVSGDPEIKPTIVENIEIGWDRDIAAIDGKFRVSIYAQSNENLKFSLETQLSALGGPAPPPGVFLYRQAGNIGDSDLVGIDLSLEGKIQDVDWSVGFSHRDVDDSITSHTAIPVAYDNSTPANIVTANAGWTHGPIELDGSVRYVAETDRFSPTATAQAHTDAYTLVNARAAWSFTDNLSIALSGHNLFDDNTETTSVPSPLGSPSAISRTFYLTLSSSF